MPENPSLIVSSTLGKLLRESFPCPIFLRDRDCNFVSESSLLAVCKWMLQDLTARGVAYSKSFDCDDFSLRFLSEVSLSNAQTKGGAGGIAVGFLFYVDNELGPHARIWFVTKEQELKFIEPQSGKIVELSTQERETAWIVFG